jgi:hypothetical protein
MRIIGNDEITARKVQAVASGALASGDTVIVNADGTVSVVALASQAVGTAVVFEPSSSRTIGSTFDSTNNRIVVGYRDQGNSNYGTVVVGSVSGSSITFGTPVVFESDFVADVIPTHDVNANKVVISYRDIPNSQYGTAVVGTVNASNNSISFGSKVIFNSSGYTSVMAAVYDATAQKIVIAWQDGGNQAHGTAIVGTVSGTSISFGSKVVFNSAVASAISCAYDSNSSKVVITYGDDGNSIYGTAIVGTVSGTGISFGSEAVFESAAVNFTKATFDSTNNKIVVAYGDAANSNYGTAAVGTVSGTSISFGAPVVFETTNVTQASIAFDSTNSKVIISYNDADNSNYGTVISGTVSGTGISFDTALVFEAANTTFTATTFDSNSNKVVISYRDGGNSNYGTSIVYTPSSSNLTSENFVGISSNGYATGQAATINVKGFIDDNQSSLTAGQSYFVQTNGDLGLTAGSPSVFAGTAVSATKLIVKG